ncbi:MAG: 2-dehydropantoate 2-reductase [Pseudomonadota bacterium]
MKVCIYGAGAVGSNFAVRLAGAGEDVSVVARGPHLAAIQRDGIQLRAGDDVMTATVEATDEPGRLGTQDLVIVTLKGPSLPSVVDGIKSLLGPNTTVVFGMNGILWWYFYGLDPSGRERRLSRLDPGDRLWDEIDPSRVVGGVVYSANEVVAPGVVQNSSPDRNQLRLGEPTGQPSARVDTLNAALNPAGLAVEVSDIRRDIWIKLLGNIAYAPIACLTGSTIGQICADEALRDFATGIMEEAIAIADAVGTSLGIDAETRIANTKASNHKPSMLQDLELGRAMEIDAIVSVPYQMGQEAGLSTPNLRRALGLLRQRARLAGLY